jgi:hypothetical protein
MRAALPLLLLYLVPRSAFMDSRYGSQSVVIEGDVPASARHRGELGHDMLHG